MNLAPYAPFAVLLAAVAGFLLGAVWYSPAGFAAAWMRLSGKRLEEMVNPMRAMFIAAVASLLSAACIGWLLAAMGITTLIGGALTGLAVGLGLVATTMASDLAFSSAPWRLWFIQGGYRVTAFTVMGAIIGAWR